MANVVMPQRHDVRTISCSTIIKSERGPKIRGIEERTNKGTESIAVAIEISGEETYFCMFLFSDKTADVL